MGGSRSTQAQGGTPSGGTTAATSQRSSTGGGLNTGGSPQQSSSATGGASGSATGGAKTTGGAKATGGTTAAPNTSTNQSGGASSGGATSGPLGGTTASVGGASNVASGGTHLGSGGASTAASGGTSAGSTQAGLRWVGRAVPIDDNSAKFGWQGAGVMANVSGTSISVKIRTEGTSTVYFQPVIDGTVLTRVKFDQGDQTVTLATGLSDSVHQVELYRETEGYEGINTFLGFTSGKVTGSPVSNGRLIEVVGDSISVGYGNLGSELHPNWVADPACHETPENTSWYATYAAVAGHALGAEVSTIARSGWGMARDRENSTANVVPSVYDHALGVSDTSTWSFGPKASVVVINLGTNDYNTGDPGTAYETAYSSFIARLRTHYPNAWIFLTIGSMNTDPKTRLANIVKTVSQQTGDTKLLAFDLGNQNVGSDGMVPTGCDWHPNVADHARMAAILKQQLQDKLGW